MEGSSAPRRLDDVEVTYFNPKAADWNAPKSFRKQKHRPNVPTSKMYDYDPAYKDLFFAKYAHYKSLSYRRHANPPITHCHIDQDMALWDVHSVHSNDWMMSGDGDHRTVVEEDQIREFDRGFVVPIVTVNGRRRFMLVTANELEEFYRNLKMKTCFRMKKFIFNMKSEGIRNVLNWWH